MARKRKAKGHQVIAEFAVLFGHFEKLFLSPDGPQMLAPTIQNLEKQLEFYNKLSLWLQTAPKTDRQRIVDEMLQTINAQIPRDTKLPLREEHLPGVSQIFHGIASALGMDETPIGDPQPARDLFGYLINQKPQVKRFKAAFEEAFKARSLTTKGKAMTLEALAKKLTPYQYRKNPDAALRSMQRGVKRVEKEHAKCLDVGIPSPFLPNTPHPN